MKKIKIYFIIGFLIGIFDFASTWYFRYVDGKRSKWYDEEIHDIWLVALSVIQIISSILFWPIKVILTAIDVIICAVTGKDFLEEVEKDTIKEY